MMNELKPCPFCGSERLDLNMEIQGGYYVECQDCFASLSWSYRTPDEAAKAWNTRACQRGTWILHEENTGWECPQCHAVFELDKGNPKDKYLNYCPVCGLKLDLPE